MQRLFMPVQKIKYDKFLKNFFLHSFNSSALDEWAVCTLINKFSFLCVYKLLWDIDNYEYQNKCFHFCHRQWKLTVKTKIFSLNLIKYLHIHFFFHDSTVNDYKENTYFYLKIIFIFFNILHKYLIALIYYYINYWNMKLSISTFIFRNFVK